MCLIDHNQTLLTRPQCDMAEIPSSCIPNEIYRSYREGPLCPWHRQVGPIPWAHHLQKEWPLPFTPSAVIYLIVFTCVENLGNHSIQNSLESRLYQTSGSRIPPTPSNLLHLLSPLWSHCLMPGLNHSY